LTASIPVGLIGGGRHAQELRQHSAPIEGVQVAHCAPSPDGGDHQRCAELARHFGAAFTPEWRALTDDPALPAIMVCGAAAARTEAIAAALAAGKIVLCPFPAARDSSALAALTEAQAKGGGVLLTIGEIAGTAAGAHLLETLRTARIGRLHSIWAAIRSRRAAKADGDVVEQHGWPLLDFLLTATMAPPLRVHPTLAHLFEPGPHPDTAVVLLRFDRELVATLEMSRCLSPSIAIPPTGEVEIEAIGNREVVRIEPYNSSVRVYGDSSVSMRPWVDSATVRVLPQLVAAVRSGRFDQSPWKRNEWAISIMDRIRSATSFSAARS
jgi:predicted dehydrogenase